jgi:hypothetical protein
MTDLTLLPETSYTRRVTFRKDTYGLYLLFWQGRNVLAGVTYQYPGLQVFSFLSKEGD